MAVGDAVSVFLGTAAGNRQPSAGVEEQLTAIAKESTTDPVLMYDGSNTVRHSDGGKVTFLDIVDANQVGSAPYNQAIIITNSVYIRKSGSSDRFYFGGIQVG